MNEVTLLSRHCNRYICFDKIGAIISDHVERYRGLLFAKKNVIISPKTCWTFIIFTTSVVTLSVAVVTYGLQPLALSVRGQFPSQSPMGKVCLLTPLENREEDQPELVKTVSITVAFTFLSLVYGGYNTWKGKRFLNRMCPNKKMACIGRYKRNVIGYKETAFVFVICSFKGILDVSMFVILIPTTAYHPELLSILTALYG